MTYLLSNTVNVTDEKVTGKPSVMSVDVGPSATPSCLEDSNSSKSKSDECAMDSYEASRSNMCEEDTEKGV